MTTARPTILLEYDTRADVEVTNAPVHRGGTFQQFCRAVWVIPKCAWCPLGSRIFGRWVPTSECAAGYSLTGTDGAFVSLAHVLAEHPLCALTLHDLVSEQTTG